jgi:outer membrane protein
LKKNSRKTVAIFLLALLTAFNVSAAELKIGVVNAAKVLEDAPQAEAARKKLEQEFAPRDKKLGEAQNKLHSMQESMDRDGSIMSEAERRKLERDIINLKRDMRRDQDAFREDLNLRRNEEFGKLQQQVTEVIVKLARDKKYDLVLTDGVIYASDKVDITTQVLDLLRELDKQKPSKSGSKANGK